MIKINLLVLKPEYSGTILSISWHQGFSRERINQFLGPERTDLNHFAVSMLKSDGNVIVFSMYSKNNLAMTRSKHTHMKHMGEPTIVCRINPINVASFGTPLTFNDNCLWTSKSNHIRFFRMLLVIHADPVYVIIHSIKLMPPLSVRWFWH